jgi:hypothetical protein
MTADVINLDLLSNTEVFWQRNRIVSRSETPQRNAGRALRAMSIPENATLHFMRFGRVVRAVQLSKLLESEAA